MNKQPVHFSLILVVGLAFGAVLTAAENSPVTLSLLGIEEPGLREQVITDLIQKYNCCVLSRSRGYSLYVEQAMDGIGTIDKLAKKLGVPQAADFAVVIRTGRTVQKFETAGEIVCADLRDPGSDASVKVVKFMEPAVDQVRATIVKTIVSAVDLKPSASTGESVQAKPGAMAVAVLPFTNCDELDVLRKPQTGRTFEALSLEAETAVQELDPSRIKLVDHNALNQVLKELNLKSAQFANPSAAGALARLVAADRIILGTVSTRDGRLRVDMELIDAGTTAIIASQCGYGTSSDDLAAVVRTTTVGLINSPARILQTNGSGEAQRKAEAAFILANSHYRDAGFLANQLVRMLSDNEVAFALDPPATQLAVLTNLCWAVETCYEGNGFALKEVKPAVHRAGDMIEEILKPLDGPVEFTIQWPLVIRGEIQMMLGNNDAAMGLIKEHLQKHPGQEEQRSWVIMAEAQYARGDQADASQTLRKIESKYGQSGAICSLAGGHTDSRVQSLAAKIQSRSGNTEEVFRGIRQRLKDPSCQDVVSIKKSDWNTYMAEIRKYEKPDEAVAELDVLLKERGRAMTEEIAGLAFVIRAKCLLDLNRKEDAVRDCKTALRISASPKCKATQDEAANLAASVEPQVGKVSELWKTLGETRQIPVGRKMYVVPVGKCDEALLRSEIKKAGDFLGVEIALLPAITISEEVARQRKIVIDVTKMATQSRPLCYDAGALWEDVIKKVTIPSDALFITFVTSEPFKGRFFVNRAFSSSGGNPVLLPVDGAAFGTILSLHYLYGGKSDHRPAEGLTSLRDGKMCKYPCFFVKRPDVFWGNCVFATCPDCQAEYIKVDFDKIQNDLMDYLKKAGTTIVKAE